MLFRSEIFLLAQKLRDLALDSSLLDAIGTGLVIPGIDEEDELTVEGIQPEDFDAAGVPADIQKEYHMRN